MAQLPAQEAIVRFKENEDRLDKFVNDNVGYTSSGGQAIESVPAFLQRIENEAESEIDSVLNVIGVSNGIYPDTASGLAAVSDGDYFSVASSNDRDYLTLYRRSGSLAIPVAKYPSSTEITDLRKEISYMNGLALYTGNGALIPIIADVKGKVILGYDTISGGLSGNNILTPYSRKLEQETLIGSLGFMKYTGSGPVFPIMLDSSNKVLLGYDSDKKKLVGAGIGDSSFKAEDLSRFGVSQMELIAHRGFRNQGIENTMLAFSTALKRGADSLETDVQVSSDGVLYLFHDSWVDSLTTGTGNFKDLTSSYIDGLYFDQAANTIFSTTKIPKFKEFLSFAKERGIYIYPEIKGYRTQADISLMIDAVVNANMVELCMFQSFNLSDLQVARSLNSKIALGWLGSSTLGYQSNFQTLSGLGNAFVLWAYQSFLSNPEIVAYAKSLGMGVSAWTVNDYDSALRLMKIGVNRIMSDISLEFKK